MPQPPKPQQSSWLSPPIESSISQTGNEFLRWVQSALNFVLYYFLLTGAVVRKGTGNGTYTTASAAYVDVGNGELSYKTVVPVGTSAKIDAKWSWSEGAAVAGFMAITDDTVILDETAITSTAVVPGFSHALFVGDGQSHNFKIRFKSDGVNTLSVTNFSKTATPVLIITFVQTRN